MSALRPITIAGGGVAGLSLGIALRRAGVPVTLWEAGQYPRHRVCGEFVSGRGQETLARMGLGEVFQRAGAIKTETAAFFSPTKATTARALPEAAICLSRFAMDAALAEEFTGAGGELRTSSRWPTDQNGPGIVAATGRRAVPQEDGQRWFGLKVHACELELTADLEMHVGAHGYVGLCRINGGRVNVCGLFRRGPHDGSAPNWREFLRGQPGSMLNQRLATAKFDDHSYCAVAGLAMQPRRASGRSEFCIGDAITMIPPVTGNGMSMALESAEAALTPLVSWSRGELSWANAQRQTALECDRRFATRLAWAHWFQRLMFVPALQSWLAMLMAHNAWFREQAFKRTR